MAESKPEINIVSLDQMLEEKRNRPIVSLCLSADASFGGGIPFGCTVIAAGPEKMGKTTVCLQYAANAQQEYDSTVYYYNIERRFGPKVYSQIRGLKHDKFHIVEPPPETNKKGEVIGPGIWSAENWLEIIGEQVAKTKRTIHIVDSISKLASEKIISETVGYQDRGASKKNESNFYQKFGDLVVPNENILFLIAQGYCNTSGYGKAFVIKIGSSMKYQADLIMIGKKAEKWDADGQSGRIMGHDAVFAVEESPLGPPHIEAKIPLRYGYGIDTEKDIIEHGIMWGFIVKSGAWYYFPYAEQDGEVKRVNMDEDGNIVMQNGEKPPKDLVQCKAQGGPAARNWLMMHPKQAKELEQDIRDMIFGNKQ